MVLLGIVAIGVCLLLCCLGYCGAAARRKKGAKDSREWEVMGDEAVAAGAGAGTVEWAQAASHKGKSSAAAELGEAVGGGRGGGEDTAREQEQEQQHHHRQEEEEEEEEERKARAGADADAFQFLDELRLGWLLPVLAEKRLATLEQLLNPDVVSDAWLVARGVDRVGVKDFRRLAMQRTIRGGEGGGGGGGGGGGKAAGVKKAENQPTNEKQQEQGASGEFNGFNPLFGPDHQAMSAKEWARLRNARDPTSGGKQAIGRAEGLFSEYGVDDGGSGGGEEEGGSTWL